MSQRSLAKRLNRDSSDISRWESGKYKIDADLLPVIAAELGADVCEFFREVEPSHRRLAELKSRYRALDRAEAFSERLATALERLSPSDRQTAEMLLSVLDSLLARSAYPGLPVRRRARLAASFELNGPVSGDTGRQAHGSVRAWRRRQADRLSCDAWQRSRLDRD